LIAADADDEGDTLGAWDHRDGVVSRRAAAL
jgi:hypothetical protein